MFHPADFALFSFLTGLAVHFYAPVAQFINGCTSSVVLLHVTLSPEAPSGEEGGVYFHVAAGFFTSAIENNR